MRFFLRLLVLSFLLIGASIANAYEPVTREEKQLVRDVINGRFHAVTEALHGSRGIIGSDIALLTWEGSPLLAYVAKAGDIPMARLLISQGADVNATAMGFPILHFTVNDGHTSMAMLLIRNGAKINAVAQNTTALDVAREMGHWELEQILLRYGAVGANAYEPEPEVRKEGSKGFLKEAQKQQSFTEGFQYGFKRGMQGTAPWYIYLLAFAIIALFTFLAWKEAKKHNRNPWIWAGLAGVTCVVPILPLLCWVPYVALRMLGTKKVVSPDG